MTPVQKAKHIILLSATRLYDCDFGIIDENNIDGIFDEFKNSDEYYDARNDIREYGSRTEITPPYVRNYDAYMLAAEYVDGTYIAWPVFYGGKHSNAEEIDWFEYAIDVSMTEKVEIVKVFTKI